MRQKTISDYLQNFAADSLIHVIGPFYQSQMVSEPVIFVDRGCQTRIEDEGISVGDGDSSDQQMDISLSPKKNISDLSFALENIPSYFQHVHLLGFLGGRRDHEYFNLGAAQHFLERRSQPSRICFDDLIYGYSAGSWAFDRYGLFSIAVLRDTLLTLHGACAYPCKKKTLFETLGSLGLSNIGAGTIYLETECPVFVILADENSTNYHHYTAQNNV